MVCNCSPAFKSPFYFHLWCSYNYRKVLNQSKKRLDISPEGLQILYTSLDSMHFHHCWNILARIIYVMHYHDYPWKIIAGTTTEIEQWPDTFQSCSHFTESTG